MSTDNIPLLDVNGPSAMQFGASKEFQRHTEQQDLDSAFLGYEKRPWMQGKTKPNVQREREAILTLFAKSKQDYVNANHVDKLLEDHISFRDLASLSNEDLEMFGFSTKKEREECLKMFAVLPNQDPSYESLCQSKAAQKYNNQIVGNAANHLMYLRSSLAATNYKLQVLPPEDLIVGDKRYASRFALEALNSVQTISDELNKDLRKLQQLQISESRKQIEEQARDSPSKEHNLKLLYFAAIALGTAGAWFWWWSKRSYSPNLDNISVKI
ncbi:PREDICTED: uncharacterized protein LOC108611262 [Drosophila arizonae]|uniref:Uncharacterized protein LOC108611262 n=1 Tax=Drosophila arizonae TaxID=7263 RepID=A0ABM1NWE3_DROAR|nr:PREDICTED: uncharacterized protein LOC108611262 [Drosophila arizonae]XP_017859279.1 PREDICTED: uncharacterized protein LOC108611262 [Drosophila arizonae]